MRPEHRGRMPVQTAMKAFLCTLLLGLVSTGAHAFGLDDVAKRARELSLKPYVAHDGDLPKALAELKYDEYRDIRFKPERSLWRDSKLPFELQFFHPGFFFKQPVRIFLVENNAAQRYRFDPKLFDYGRNQFEPRLLAEVEGYAGFRVHYPLNSRAYKDELIVFQGASYFRALGKGQQYGLSARGLAVDTAAPSGEEFPAFTDFWIVRPKADDRELVIYALLDSPSVTGAYRFVVRPGDTTEMSVQSRVFLREKVGKLGIAPLTSMFDFGENDPSPRVDYRPEVHDSDGLLVQMEREWLWRPLSNPRRLLVTSFSAVSPRGFGLMQRDRNFSHYEDLEARYDLRPSAWIKPQGDWGPGRIELVQIPTPNETNDNIVAYWVPDQLPERGQPLSLAYTLSWQMKNETQPSLARVMQTRRGHGFLTEEDDSIRYTVDFIGDNLQKLPADAKVTASVWVGDNGKLLEHQAYRNPVTGGWRVSMRLEREDEDQPVEMRCMLRNKDQVISETWTHVLPALDRR